MAILNIFIVLFLLSSMIIIHEFGHWIVARKLGFQTPMFGFGLPFGPHIKLGTWKETEFRFHWFVLGGYVAIPELGDESQEELMKELPALKPLQTFPVWKRACVASAGVVFNLLFAFIVCLAMVATIGPPSSKGKVVITHLLDSTKSAGSYSSKPNLIAKNAGLLAGDIILKVNSTSVKDPSEVVNIVRSNALKEITFKIKRTYKEKKKKSDILLLKVTPSKEGTIGIGLGLMPIHKYDKPSKNPLIWIYQASYVLFDWSASMLIGIGLMLMNLLGFSPIGSPKIAAEDLHGVLAIVSVFAQAISIDFREVFRWTALINVNLAIVNLLPIPALDGGHLLFMFIEKLRGRKLADSVQQKAIQTGFLLLLVLMFFVLFNDVKGLISGKFNISDEKQVEKSKD